MGCDNDAGGSTALMYNFGKSYTSPVDGGPCGVGGRVCKNTMYVKPQFTDTQLIGNMARQVLEQEEFDELVGNDAPQAWAALLAKVASGELHPDARSSYEFNGVLLHVAARHSTASVMLELLKLNATPSATNAYKELPMHVAVLNKNEPLEICKLLPARGLAAVDLYTQSPLHSLVYRCLGDPYNERLLKVLAWMLDQPECPLEARNSFTHPLLDVCKCYAEKMPASPKIAAMLTDAIAARRRRWTPARATWIAAAVAIDYTI